MTHHSTTPHTGRRARRLVAAASLLFAGLASATPSDLVRETNLRRGMSDSMDILGLDSVDRLTGNLVTTIDLGQHYPASGRFGYSFALRYNAQIWDYTTRVNDKGATLVAAQPVATTNAGVGWDLSFGRLLAPASSSNPLGQWVYVEPDGQRHVLYDTARPGDSPASDVFYARDGSYIQLALRPDGRRTVRHPNGIRRIFSDTGAGWVLDEYRDIHNGRLQITYAPDGTWTTSDQHRGHSVFFKADPTGTYPRLLDRVELAAFGGATAVYTFQYTTQTLTRPAGDTDDATPATIDASVLTRVVLPDGTDYELTYDTSALASGRLASLLLPTLGTYTWTYQAWDFPWLDCATGLDGHVANAVGVGQRCRTDKNGQADGCWTYTPSLDIPRPSTNTCEQPKARTTTVLDPLGHERRYHFATYVSGTATAPGGTWSTQDYGQPFTKSQPAVAGLLLSNEVLETSQLLRSERVAVTTDTFADCAGPCAGVNPRTTSSRTTFHDDGGHFTQVDHTNDGGWGRFETTTAWSSFPGDVPTTTTVDLIHATGPWMLNKVIRRERSQGSETRVVERCLDTNGKLLRERRLAGASPGAHDLITEYAYDTLGQEIEKRSFGGDVDTLPTTGDLCTLTLPAAQYETVSAYVDGALASSHYTDATGQPFLVTVDRDIDPGTGKTETDRTAAGYATTYDYDLLGRQTEAAPQDGAITQWIYTKSSATANAKTFVHRLAEDGITIIHRAKTEADDFGRTIIETRTDFNNKWEPDTVTTWDAVGNRIATTDPLARTTQYLEYDPFGRSRRTRPPSGATDDRTTSYLGVRVATQNRRAGHYLTDPGLSLVQETRSSTATMDRKGRVIHAVGDDGEPSTYAYDIDGHAIATTVTRTNDVPVTLSQRTYDGRGFVVATTDADGVVTTIGDYDARGRRTQRTTTHGTVVNTFDRAGRLTETRDGLGTVLQRFVYATSNNGVDLRAGRLWQTERHNHGIVGLVGAAVVREENTYAGKGGRISARTTSLSDDGGLRQSFDMSVTYNDLGAADTFTYPQCSASWGMTCHTMARTVHHEVHAKNHTLLKGVVSQLNSDPPVRFVDEMRYHDDGSLDRVWFGDDRFVYEVHTPHATVPGARQKTSICTTAACNHFDPLVYDGSGNLVRVQAGPVFPDDEIYLPVGVPDPPSSLATTATLRDLMTSGGTAPSTCPTYDHDALGAVRSVELCDGTIGARHEYYVYDAYGRVLWRTGSDNGTSPAAYASRWTLRDFAGRTVRTTEEITSATWVHDSIHRGGTLVGKVRSWGPLIFDHYREYIHSDHLGRPFSKHTVENGAPIWERD